MKTEDVLKDFYTLQKESLLRCVERGLTIKQLLSVYVIITGILIEQFDRPEDALKAVKSALAERARIDDT